MKFTRILIIDDHVMFRQGISMVLNSVMPEALILEAGSMAEAFTKARATPSVVLLDVQLPGLSGLEGLIMIKKKWPDTPVIMLSSHLESEVIDQALNRGAMSFVSKVESAEKILKTITLALAGDFLENHAENTSPLQTANHLTQRQHEVLDLLCQGLSNKIIARQLILSEFTVRGHVQAVFRFLNVSSRSEAMFAARRLGLIN